MNKNQFAMTPPMGWNSYDNYDTTVTEEQIKQNADYMAANLKQYGWEYIVVDIEWYSYDTGTQRDRYQYIPFWKVEMDEYSRLLPCPQKFPSSVNGAGFKPLADYVHALGLKFGIHIMRGIPREAAHNHGKLYGTEKTANELANPSDICAWNPDMYGVRPDMPEAQLYYDSIFELYAKWGVDFVKCDDICRMDMPASKEEIQMLHRAILKCGRAITLSLSPGPAKIEEAWLYETNANMWRITDDLWDNWTLLKEMFGRTKLWQSHVTPGNWPDCDMLPLGKIGAAFREQWDCNLTYDEQITMMNLWCIFRSPLMLGADLLKLDEKTTKLLTNEMLIRCIRDGSTPSLLKMDDTCAVWRNHDNARETDYYAFFNLSDEEQTISCCMDTNIPDVNSRKEKVLTQAWEKSMCSVIEQNHDRIQVTLRPHASAFCEVK